MASLPDLLGSSVEHHGGRAARASRCPNFVRFVDRPGWMRRAANAIC